MEKSDIFKKDPYNPNNKFITQNDIINIMKSLNINEFNINHLQYYQTAFIHKSYCHMVDYEEFTNDNNDLALQKISYETMEFLGDSILSSSISSYLYQRFYEIHDQNEGFLTKIRTRIVCGEALAKLSSKLGLNRGRSSSSSDMTELEIFSFLSKKLFISCDNWKFEFLVEEIINKFFLVK